MAANTRPPSDHTERWYIQLTFALLFLAGVRPVRDDSHREDLERPRPAQAPPIEPPRLFVTLAAQDWLLLLYLGLLLAKTVAGHGPRRQIALEWVTLDMAVWASVLVVARSRLLREGSLVSTILYRAGIGFPVLASFLQLQWILPTASDGAAVDARLYAFDLRVFGVEPAEAWDRFVTPSVTEWFAFFYYGYFFLIALHVLPMLMLAKSSKLLARFSFGFIWLYCVGHALYTFVPAYGPYAYLAPKLHHVLAGPTWWPIVKRTVESVDGGARTDVFPSLHTGLPTFLSLFSFQHRKRLPFRYTWLPLTLFTTQIIGATMFLRWHYLVDICAGILLAISGVLASDLALRWDAARERHGGRPVWPPYRAHHPTASTRIRAI